MEWKNTDTFNDLGEMLYKAVNESSEEMYPSIYNSITDIINLEQDLSIINNTADKDKPVTNAIKDYVVQNTNNAKETYKDHILVTLKHLGSD